LPGNRKPNRRPSPEDVQARNRARTKIREAKQNERLKNFEYMEEKGRFGVSKVKCKCGQVLQELLAIPEMAETEVRGGQTIIKERVAMFTNAAYTEVEITFDDGSKHITPSCVSCVSKGFSNDVLNDMYAADMDRWDQEEQRGLGNVRWTLNADRTAVKWREIDAKERFRD
jgi:hypothetical protein